MATLDNYFPGSTNMNPQQRISLIMERMRSVIEGSELIRKECNRIRNEMLTLGQEPDTELLALVSLLQTILAHLRVKYGYMTGLKGDDMLALLEHLKNPMSQLSNEDSA